MTTLPGISLPDDRYRRIAGFCLGALVGMTYGLVWQYGDRLAIPGTPLYQPPFGLLGNVLMFGAGAGLLGLLAAWPRSGVAGTSIASALSAVAIVVWSYAQAAGRATENLGATLVTGLFVALPFWGLLVPALGALRWVVSHDEEARRDHERWYRRIWQPVLLLLAVGLLTLPARYNEDARTLLARTNQMLQSAEAGRALPEPLASTEFAARGKGAYELSWERQHIEKYRIPRPGRNFDQHSVVVARFKNGWNLVCLYITLDDPPVCRGMEELPS